MSHKERDYYESLDIFRLNDNRLFGKWMDAVVRAGFDVYKQVAPVWYSSDVAARKKIFGPQSFCVAYGSRHWVWRIDLMHGYLWILTSKEGTSYEYYTSAADHEDLVVEIIGFLCTKYGFPELAELE